MRAAAALLACLLLAACSGVEVKRGAKSHARREVPPGPGLLTGSKGEFVIFRWQDPAATDETAAKKEPPDSQAPK